MMRAIELKSIFLEDTDVYDDKAFRQTTKTQFLNGYAKSDVQRKKTGLEEALEDVANGRLTTIHIPKKLKAV